MRLVGELGQVIARSGRAFAKEIYLAARTPRGMLWLAAGGLLIGALAFGGESLDRHLATIEAWIGSLGLAGRLALIPLYILLTSLLFPDSVLRLAAGALFGVA